MRDEKARCRSCGSLALESFLDLGETPLADALVPPDRVGRPDERFPLELAFCSECTLVQILEEVAPEKLFVDNYLYFSSFSDVLLDHAAEHARSLIERRRLKSDSLVVEIASNDGYLLRNFVERGIPVLGIDPAPDQARAANEAGIRTLAEFFGPELATRLVRDGSPADVIIANNVMAHVPDLNGFVEGIRILLGQDGIATIENPYVRDLVTHVEFDTIYHEHFCYYSCTAVDALMRRHGLSLNDIDSFPDLHGGTLRWTVSKHDDPSDRVRGYLDDEATSGMTSFDYYRHFAEEVSGIITALRELLVELRASGKRIAAYGAAAKGSTLLNTARIGTDLVDFVVDRNVHKQGLFMPGVHLPIRGPEALLEEEPDYVLLLAWNFKDEIMRQQAEYRERGGRFIVPVPEPSVIG